MKHIPARYSPGSPDLNRAAAPAFTIVELIVVIGIIALLISILLPVVGVAQTRAKQLKCLANLRNIGQAAELHISNHRGYLPAAGHHWAPTGGVVNPRGLDDPEGIRYSYYNDNGVQRPLPVSVAFARETGLPIRTDSRENLIADLELPPLKSMFHCPMQDSQSKGCSQAQDDLAWVAPYEYSDYIFNEALMGRREQGPGRAIPILGHASAVIRSSIVFLAADGLPRHHAAGDWIVIPNSNTHETLGSFAELTIWGIGAARTHFDYKRHNYHINVVFLDGHAESFLMTDQGLGTIGVSQGIYD